jgi:site-specific recombinase XerD
MGLGDGVVQEPSLMPYLLPSQTGSAMEYQNFRSRVFNRIVRRVFSQGRRVTAHCLGHTFASLQIPRASGKVHEVALF